MRKESRKFYVERRLKRVIFEMGKNILPFKRTTLLCENFDNFAEILRKLNKAKMERAGMFDLIQVLNG